MKVKIFIFFSPYDPASCEKMENKIQKFLGSGVRVRHVAQSSTTPGGLGAETIITVFYERASA